MDTDTRYEYKQSPNFSFEKAFYTMYNISEQQQREEYMKELPIETELTAPNELSLVYRCSCCYKLYIIREPWSSHCTKCKDHIK